MKGPRFFCDNCGDEVPFNKKRCPRCGRFFASIRCPRCSFTGEDALFKTGCPICGYSVPQNLPPQKKFHSGHLPPWVYLLTIAALAAVLVVMVSSLR